MEAARTPHHRRGTQVLSHTQGKDKKDKSKPRYPRTLSNSYSSITQSRTLRTQEDIAPHYSSEAEEANRDHRHQVERICHP